MSLSTCGVHEFCREKISLVILMSFLNSRQKSILLSEYIPSRIPLRCAELIAIARKITFASAIFLRGNAP